MATFSSLDAWLSHLETAHSIPIVMGLARINRVKELLGLTFPCPVFTVGGTNGKGSTCAMLEAILLASGYRVGVYTSPHLLKFNERARINGDTVNDDLLLQNFEAVEAARCSFDVPVSLTYFEFTTLAIMHLFATSAIDVVILEVGLGGRLDAVNIIDTDCAIITSIDVDHQEFLGDTREAIAIEKTGIFRIGKPAICGDPVPPETLIGEAKRIGADLWLFGRDFNYHGDKQQWNYVGRGMRRSALAYPALRGTNQLLNASAVLAALEAMRMVLPVSAQDIRLGLASVKLSGRFEVLPGSPSLVLDVAHNPHAAAVLSQNLDGMRYFPSTHAVFGAMADKDIKGVLHQLIHQVDHWYLCDLPILRAADTQHLETYLRAAGFVEDANHSVTHHASPEDAVSTALKLSGENDRIVIFGSFLTVAGVMRYQKLCHH
ncbi:bifunctional tetrahydrofolate synthase/dihydrofolate synthase [Candidatus Pandoraea novymonadis]|nr:bifunctional tetrahydrofolate synthase/dihydrofolate synthase [Candidatus Pandoraea novymonadis]